jgi:DNA-directed RNA polymerase sigma subunit (sigma70/sigma32)
VDKHLFKREKRNNLIEDVFGSASYFNYIEDDLYRELEPKNLILSRIKNILDNEMSDALRFRYDLDNTGRYYTLKEISKNLKIKIELARQKIQKALRILRHPKNSKRVFPEYYAYKEFLKMQECEHNYDFENNKSLFVGYISTDKAFDILRRFKIDTTISSVMLKIIEIYNLLNQSHIEKDKRNLFITEKTGFLKVFLGLDFQTYKTLYVNDLQDEINSELLEEKNKQESIYKFINDKNLLKSIEELELSIRTTNCLKNANIKTVIELVQKTEGEVLGIKSFGKKSLDEIKEVLSEMGLSFGMKLY